MADTSMTEVLDSPLANEIAAFDKLKPELLKYNSGKFVIIRGGKLAGVWDTFDAAAIDAVKKFGRGPYLIRQVGAPAPTLPASVIYRPLEPR